VISATNVNLKEKVEQGLFREDLYYRLNVFPIEIPPLRERIDDIKDLTYRFIEKLNTEYGRDVKEISNDALEILKNYKWPGNVRELENVIGRSIINMNINEKIIKKEHLPGLVSINFPDNLNHKLEAYEKKIETLASAINEFEKDYIQNIYEFCNKNKTLTAKTLKISIRSLYYKMEKYDIN
jgi:transcriptional regulator with PAS, ATPase and Fis domain